MDSKPLTMYVSDANEHQRICIEPEMVTKQPLIQSDLKPLPHHLPTLQRQRRYLNPMGPDVCYHCNTFFHSPTDLIHHQLAKHATTFCILFQKEFSARTKWRRHVNSVHGFGKIVTCPYCDKSGYRQDLIFNHIMNTHNLFPCRECKQREKMKRILVLLKTTVIIITDEDRETNSEVNFDHRVVVNGVNAYH